MRKAPIVMVALAVSIAMALGWAAEGVLAPRPSTAFSMAMNAGFYAVGAALIIGFLELASRLRGGAAAGMKVAAIGVACGRVDVLVRWIAFTESPRHVIDLVTLFMVVSIASSLCTIVGLVIAAWPRRNRAIAGGVAALATFALSVIVIPLLVRFVAGTPGMVLVAVAGHLPWIGQAVALMWLVAQISPTEAEPDPRLAARGVRWMSRALLGRVFAVIAFVFVAISSTRNEHTLQGLYVGELAVTLVLFGAFAIGAFAVVKAATTGVRRVPFVLAGLGMFWCAAMTLVRAPMIYEIIAGRGGMESFIESHTGVFAIAEPLVMLLSIGAVANGLRSIAAVRTSADPSTGVAFAVIMVAAIWVQEWGLRAADSQSSLIGVMLLASILGIIAMGLMAMVLGAAAARLEGDTPDLPTAKVV